MVLEVVLTAQRREIVFSGIKGTLESQNFTLSLSLRVPPLGKIVLDLYRPERPRSVSERNLNVLCGFVEMEIRFCDFVSSS